MGAGGGGVGGGGKGMYCDQGGESITYIALLVYINEMSFVCYVRPGHHSVEVMHIDNEKLGVA